MFSEYVTYVTQCPHNYLLPTIWEVIKKKFDNFVTVIFGIFNW